jgi:hypothetical protein
VLSASAQMGGPPGGGQGGPPGGGGGGNGVPSCPATFSASAVGTAHPSCDRLLMETVPGETEVPSKMNGSVPIGSDKTKIPKAHWSIDFQAFTPDYPTSASVSVMYTPSPLWDGDGATGIWNGSDNPGATILPNGNTAGGYTRWCAQPFLDSNYPWARSNAPYQYFGKVKYYYSVYVGSSPATAEVRTAEKPVSSGILYRRTGEP